MPDVEATRDLIQRAKDWTGKIALDADTFSLIREMWTALEEGVHEPPLPEPLKIPSEAELIEWVHRRNNFDYDECQHGTYSGGPSNGEPYSMCQRQGRALHVMLTSPLSSPQPVITEPVEERVRREAQNEILEALEAYRNSRKTETTIAHATDALRVARAVAARITAPEDEPARSMCVHCGTAIQEASKHNGFVHGWRHLNGMLDFRKDMGGHDARPADWTDPDQGPKSKKLSKIVKQAATRNHGGYPDESLMLLAEELKLNGL